MTKLISSAVTFAGLFLVLTVARDLTYMQIALLVVGLLCFGFGTAMTATEAALEAE